MVGTTRLNENIRQRPRMRRLSFPKALPQVDPLSFQYSSPSSALSGFNISPVMAIFHLEPAKYGGPL